MFFDSLLKSLWERIFLNSLNVTMYHVLMSIVISFTEQILMVLILFYFNFVLLWNFKRIINIFMGQRRVASGIGESIKLAETIWTISQFQKKCFFSNFKRNSWFSKFKICRNFRSTIFCVDSKSSENFRCSCKQKFFWVWRNQKHSGCSFLKNRKLKNLSGRFLGKKHLTEFHL